MKRLTWASAVLATLSACGGGGGVGAGGNEEAPNPQAKVVTFDWTVDALAGNDASPGTDSQPFRTITKALEVATDGQKIRVRAGTYDAAHGESFPLVVPAGVRLIGDEETLGTGTAIRGGGNVPWGNLWISVTIVPGARSEIAGFTVTNDTKEDFVQVFRVETDEVAIRNNTLVDTKQIYSSVIQIGNGSRNQVIAGNRIENNGWLAIGFINGGEGARVEHNVIRNNLYGIEYDSPGGDLGGGAANSQGGNVIAGNKQADLWTNTPGLEIDARNNFWDHAPPTEATEEGNGIDIRKRLDNVVHTEGAKVAQ